ncbi:adipocyte plasma membrane-associated protein-like [Amblyomma americanum]
MFFRLLKCAFRFFLYFLIVFLVLPFIPLSLDFQPVSYEVKLPEFKGPLAQNQALDKVQYLYPNQFVGPESLEAHEGSIYTGVIGGQILRLTGTKVTPVVKFGKACEGPWDEGICGRPLGLRFDKQGRLYVADAYSGISIVDVTKGFVTPLVPAGIDLDGHPLTFVNDVVIDGDGNVFFTETSTKWPLNKIVYSILEHENSGRVLMYDAKTKRTHILLEDLYCPNGIELGPDGDSIIIAELSMKRLLRYYYRGAHKGDLDVFADNLPGDPDNIRRTPRGGYWVAFASGRSSDKASVLDHLAPYPLVRKSVVRLLYLLGSALKYASTLYDWAPLKDVASRIDNGWILYEAVPRYGLIVELDASGKPIRSLHSPAGKIHFISEVLEHEGHLYLGSFRNRFIGRVKA